MIECALRAHMADWDFVQQKKKKNKIPLEVGHRGVPRFLFVFLV